MIIALLVLAVAYLLGSVQTGVLLSRLFKFSDPRESGSGNSGATNVARSQGLKVGAVVLLGDLLKGVLAVLLAKAGHVAPVVVGCAGLVVVVGHMYPLFYKFKGGKGVATGLGVFLAFAPLAALVSLLVFAAIFVPTRYVSLASIVSAVFGVLFIGILAPGYFMLPLIMMVILVIVRHADNITRLLAGNESKFK